MKKEIQEFDKFIQTLFGWIIIACLGLCYNDFI